MLIEKILFLQHGGVSVPNNTFRTSSSSLTGVIVIAVLLALGIGLWILLTRKRKI